jgi:hypothetical protein
MEQARIWQMLEALHTAMQRDSSTVDMHVVESCRRLLEDWRMNPRFRMAHLHVFHSFYQLSGSAVKSLGLVPIDYVLPCILLGSEQKICPEVVKVLESRKFQVMWLHSTSTTQFAMNENTLRVTTSIISESLQQLEEYALEVDSSLFLLHLSSERDGNLEGPGVIFCEKAADFFQSGKVDEASKQHIHQFTVHDPLVVANQAVLSDLLLYLAQMRSAAASSIYPSSASAQLTWQCLSHTLLQTMASRQLLDQLVNEWLVHPKHGPQEPLEDEIERGDRGRQQLLGNNHRFYAHTCPTDNATDSSQLRALSADRLDSPSFSSLMIWEEHHFRHGSTAASLSSIPLIDRKCERKDDKTSATSMAAALSQKDLQFLSDPEHGAKDDAGGDRTQDMRLLVQRQVDERLSLMLQQTMGGLRERLKALTIRNRQLSQEVIKLRKWKQMQRYRGAVHLRDKLPVALLLALLVGIVAYYFKSASFLPS